MLDLLNKPHITEADGKETQLSIADQALVGTTHRSRRPRLTPEELGEIARLYTEEAASPSELRARFGIGDSSLYRMLQKQGVTLRGRSVPRLSLETPVLVAWLRDQVQLAADGHEVDLARLSAASRRRTGPQRLIPFSFP